MKECKTCKQIKPLTKFYKDKSFKSGYRANCKECKDKSTMAWREANREQYNANQRKQHAKHYQRNRLYRYDITPERHAEMLIDQEGLCAICNNPPSVNRPLVIDHDHSTNEVRGLLCYKCNRDMVAVDNKEHLAKLLEYRDKKHLK